jgi:hypothetical protein
VGFVLFWAVRTTVWVMGGNMTRCAAAIFAILHIPAFRDRSGRAAAISRCAGLIPGAGDTAAQCLAWPAASRQGRCLPGFRIRLVSVAALVAVLLSLAGTGAAAGSSFARPAGPASPASHARADGTVAKPRTPPEHRRREASTARRGAKAHFAYISSRRNGKRSKGRRRAAAGAGTRPVVAAPPTEQGTITFSELPDGS